MAVTREDLEHTAKEIQRNLTSCQQHLGELLRAIGNLPAEQLTDPKRCPECGIAIRPPLTLSEHLHYRHDRPTTTASTATVTYTK